MKHVHEKNLGAKIYVPIFICLKVGNGVHTEIMVVS
jgi:hypothetical protein